MEDLAGEPPRDLMGSRPKCKELGSQSGPEEVREGGCLCATCLGSPGFCSSGRVGSAEAQARPVSWGHMVECWAEGDRQNQP